MLKKAGHEASRVSQVMAATASDAEILHHLYAVHSRLEDVATELGARARYAYSEGGVMSVRMLAWLDTGTCRLGERVGAGWRVSKPLEPPDTIEAMRTFAAGGSPTFEGHLVYGIAGATDVTDHAAIVVARLDVAGREARRTSGVRLLAWNSREHRLAEPCEHGWRLSAPLRDQALWAAMRAIAKGRRPRFVAVGQVAGFVGDVAEITAEAAAEAIVANGK